MSELRWRKSSFSDNPSHCVEVAATRRTLAVRDSKNPGPVLAFPADRFAVFLRSLQPLR